MNLQTVHIAEQQKDSKALYEHWGEPRCWGYRVPFSIIKKKKQWDYVLPATLAKWKQKQSFLSKNNQKWYDVNIMSTMDSTQHVLEDTMELDGDYKSVTETRWRNKC